MTDELRLRPVGTVRSPLTDRHGAPRQPEDGAPPAWLEFEPDVADALADVAVGDRLVLLTWLHLADREVQVVRPRRDPTRPPRGVFRTCSPDRPNPVGLHHVEVLERDGLRVRVAALEAVDGTPIIDVKRDRTAG